MTWAFVDNPAFAGQAPRPLRAACHDGSPFVTIRCDCGTEMHLHETQLRDDQLVVAIATYCKGCGRLLRFAPGELAGAFAQMRADGWIADDG